MRILLLTLISIGFTLSAFSQNASIRAKVQDQKNKPVPFASIYIMKSTDSSSAGAAVTNETGQFIVERLPYGTYIVRISSIGFIDFWQQATLSESASDANLATITLVETGKNLKEVEVGAERKLIENSVDKKVFQVDKSIISQSGSAIDALQQIPNVTTDENGNLQMRGAEGVLILINGKQTGIKGASLQTILNQIPANTIEKIEVITNPSSKYDAEGSNGIINIVLKRNKNAGVNGNINAQVGTRDKYNLSAGLSYNKGKIGLSATYGLRYNTMNWHGYLHRQLIPADTNYYFNTENNGFNRNLSHTTTMSADYYFSKFKSLSLAGSGNFGRGKSPEWIQYNERDNLNEESAHFARFNDIHSQNRTYNVNTQFRRTFDKSTKEYTISANFTNNSDTNTLNGVNNYTLLNFLPYDSISDRRQNRSKSYTKNAMLQTDFILPLKKDKKIETGLKMSYRSFDNEMRISKLNTTTDNWYLDSGLSNRFVYSELINAGYLNYAGTYKKLSYQAGARVEQTITDGTLKYDGRKVGYSRIDFFPGFYILKKIKTAHEWKINYTRRIERPSGGQLNPFSDLSDPRNIRRGNPDLKPQFINSYELDYTYTTKKLMTNPGLYYKQTNNLMWRYMTINDGVNYVSFENIGSSYQMGLEWVTTYSFTKWFNTLTSVNVYNNRISGTVGGMAFDNSNIMSNIRQMANLKFKKIIDIQFTYNYRSPFIGPQGKSIPMQWLDFGTTVQVLKNKGTVTLTISDIFDTRQFGMDLVMPNVNQQFLRKMESRILYVGFNYRFGSTTGFTKPKKRETQEQRMDDIGF